MLYKRLEPKDGTVAQFAAVYITRWRPEWGEPTELFVEADDPVLDAAPEMLAALEAVAATIDKHRQWWDDRFGDGQYDANLSDEQRVLFSQIEVAIAKVKGERQ